MTNMERKFAIYLNANARRVSPDVVSRIEELVHPDDIFFCNSMEDGLRYAQVILDRGYPTVFTGGGDGTVVQLINSLYSGVDSKVAGSIPALGVLSLGTGNALSRLVSSGSAISDLKAYVSNPSNDIWTIGLVETDGLFYPFGGVGVDAEILTDYKMVKEKFGQGPFKPIFQNVGGYFFAFFGATVPRHVKTSFGGKKVIMKAINLSDRAYEIGPQGEATRAFGPGETLFEGHALIAVVGTTPLYGYGMRLLPWADRRADFMHMRLWSGSFSLALANLHLIWNGSFENEHMHDFYAEHVRLVFSEPVPFQMAGDSGGYRDSVEFRHFPNSLRLVRFI